MNKGPQVFDLPVANLHQLVGHYTPPPARDPDEIERRQANPKGSVILEAQADGVEIVKRTFQEIYDDPEVRDYFAREMGGVCLNTAWYSYANIELYSPRPAQDNVGRRRLELPKHALIDDEGIVHYETQLNNGHEIEDGLAKAAVLASRLEAAHKNELEIVTYRTRKQFGHKIGNVGLRLAATPLLGSRADAYEVQSAVRDAGTQAVENSRELHDGTYPTVAQLVDLDSQLSVHLRRASPTLMRNALINATVRVYEQRKEENNV